MKLSPVIDVDDLFKIQLDDHIKIFDVSNGAAAYANYQKEHLQGALFMDLNTQLADIKDDLSIGGRHPLPTVENFIDVLSTFGVSQNSHIILYDDKNGANAAARFWWMLRSIGHEKVQVLNGGFAKAKSAGYPVCSIDQAPGESLYSCQIAEWQFPTISIEELEQVLYDSAYLVIDVRAKERFDGLVEPIDPVAGHIPNAINIPYTKNLNEEGLFKKPNELKAMYQKAMEHRKSKHCVVHCGSGVTACHTLLAWDYADLPIPRLYVGSWSEWCRSNKDMVLHG